MQILTDHPVFLSLLSFAVLWLFAAFGRARLRRYLPMEEEIRQDFGLILGATLTLLGLLIGFSFSMATSRYDQRKNLEEEEANAIGTEYGRADLIPSDARAAVRDLLRKYLDLRIRSYVTQDEDDLRRIDAATAKVQGELWSAVVPQARAQPTPVAALAVAGMNDVLNSQGYTQAAWRNRIPPSAWGLMIAIAVGCNLLLGYGLRGAKSGSALLPILPLIIAIAFMLIADIDAPRHGIIRVKPLNLMSLAQSLQSP
jgi:hypothetical protein